MLIGQVLRLDFGGYIGIALAPSILGLVAVWALIAAGTRGAGARPQRRRRRSRPPCPSSTSGRARRA
jgi:hypothetical protein